MVAYWEHGIPKDPSTGLWHPNTFQFGDWLDPNAPANNPGASRTNPIYVADTWLAHSTIVLCEVAKILQDGNAAYWVRKRDHVVGMWRGKYIVPSKMAGGAVLTSDTQTAYSLAINFGLLPQELVKSCVDRLHELMKENKYHLATGFAGTPELLHAISSPRSAESIALAYRVLMEPRTSPSWMYPITMGATSIWERWDAMRPDGSVNTSAMTSFNHYAYGAVGRWIFESVGGVRVEMVDGVLPLIVFEPVPCLEFGVKECDMAVNLIWGRVECKWKVDEEVEIMWVEVVMPGNMDGEVRFPSGKVIEVSSGTWKLKDHYRIKKAKAESLLLEEGSNVQEFKSEAASEEHRDEIDQLNQHIDEWVVVEA